MSIKAQMSLPDIFIWLVSGKNRIAYCRVSSDRLLYSETTEERGDLCGRMTRLFLKVSENNSI